MVRAVGFEPTTNGLKVRCSTTELHPQALPVYGSGRERLLRLRPFVSTRHHKIKPGRVKPARYEESRGYTCGEVDLF
jgi:hypothetical protein